MKKNHKLFIVFVFVLFSDLLASFLVDKPIFGKSLIFAVLITTAYYVVVNGDRISQAVKVRRLEKKQKPVGADDQKKEIEQPIVVARTFFFEETQELYLRRLEEEKKRFGSIIDKLTEIGEKYLVEAGELISSLPKKEDRSFASKAKVEILLRQIKDLECKGEWFIFSAEKKEERYIYPSEEEKLYSDPSFPSHGKFSLEEFVERECRISEKLLVEERGKVVYCTESKENLYPNNNITEVERKLINFNDRLFLLIKPSFIIEKNRPAELGKKYWVKEDPDDYYLANMWDYAVTLDEIDAANSFALLIDEELEALSSII